MGAVLHAQTHSVRFKKLSVDDGLTQNSVISMTQDRFGFMWFGTQDGLNRYDGYHFDNWRTSHQIQEALCDNYVWNIFEDTDGIIWIATFQGGLIRLDQVNNRITCFNKQNNKLPSDRIFSITGTHDGKLWLGSNEGLIAFDTDLFSSEIFLNTPMPKGATP